MLSVTTILVSVTLCIGQVEAKPGMPAPVQQALEKHLMGGLVFEGTFGDKKFTGEESWRWANDKSTAIIEGFIEMDGVKLPYTSVAGWEASTKALLITGFFAGGDTATTRWTEFSTDVWKGRIVGTLEGKAYESAAKMEFKDDSVRYEDTTAGKPWISVGTRKPAPKAPSHYEHLKNLEAFIGAWEAKEADGSTTTWTFKWAYDKNIVENQVTSTAANGDVTFSNRGMMGWDEGSRRMTNWCFDKDGRPVTFLWAQVDEKTWDTWWPGTSLSWKIKWTDNDTWEMVSDGGGSVFKRTAQ
jgi:hypothetical protein